VPIRLLHHHGRPIVLARQCKLIRQRPDKISIDVELSNGPLNAYLGANCQSTHVSGKRVQGFPAVGDCFWKYLTSSRAQDTLRTRWVAVAAESPSRRR